MKAVIKEEPNAKKLMDEGDAGQNNRRRGFCHGSHRNNNAAGGGGSSGNTPNAKCPTCNKDLPENLIFDNTGHNDAANFHRTLKGLANFMHTAYSAKVVSAILKMRAVTIPIEEEPKARKDSARETTFH